jgi:hypothetical protein
MSKAITDKKGYLLDKDFQTAFLERGVDCSAAFLDERPSNSQL